MASRFLFTSRHGGVSQAPYDQRNLALHVGDDPSDVIANRLNLAVELGIEGDALFFMNQVHGCEVIEITHDSVASSARECDALITRTPGIALAVLVADCAPVILIGERSSAVIHVGWRGLFGGIVEKVVALMAPERFRAQIGPTICGNCYQVGNELKSEAIARGFVTQGETLDIPASIGKILMRVAPERLLHAEWNGVCTLESPDHFSYRRENVTGRTAGVILHGS